MRIGHFQCVCPEGDFAQNLALLRRGLERAADARLQLVSFPESFLTGYYRHEADARRNAFAVDSPQMAQVLAVTRAFPLTALLGFNELRGDRLHISMAVVEGGKVAGLYRKLFPIFAHETPGDELPVFETGGLRFGIIICADSGYIEPCRILALKGARVVFSPHHNYVDDPLDHCLMARRQHAARAVENGIYFVRGNNLMPAKQYGQPINGVPYFGYGDSYILDPRGETVAGAGLHYEALMIYELDPDRYRPNPARKSASRRSAERLLGELQAALDGAPDAPARPRV